MHIWNQTWAFRCPLETKHEPFAARTHQLLQENIEIIQRYLSFSHKKATNIGNDLAKYIKCQTHFKLRAAYQNGYSYFFACVLNIFIIF